MRGVPEKMSAIRGERGSTVSRGLPKVRCSAHLVGSAVHRDGLGDGPHVVIELRVELWLHDGPLRGVSPLCAKSFEDRVGRRHGFERGGAGGDGLANKPSDCLQVCVGGPHAHVQPGVTFVAEKVHRHSRPQEVAKKVPPRFADAP